MVDVTSNNLVFVHCVAVPDAQNISLHLNQHFGGGFFHEKAKFTAISSNFEAKITFFFIFNAKSDCKFGHNFYYVRHCMQHGKPLQLWCDEARPVL